ncbi:hypothetical protein FRB96_007050 [Tulasnella sp. 330]|nr:hypothetical protein FRB96_007050 [Tulasnella sp. 330]KAG8872459.1 hypothetical protein FRB97_007620 [Tulasnella sp. 331]
MKAHLAHVVLPRGAAGARRKLSNVAAGAVLIPQSSSIFNGGSSSSSSPSSAVLLFDLPMGSSGSGGAGSSSSSGGGGGPRLPQSGKSTVQTSLSLTTYGSPLPPPPSNSQSQQSSQNQTYARFTAPWTSYNNSLSYNNSIPPAVLPQPLPQQRFSRRSGAAEKEDEDESMSGSAVAGYSLEMGAYGIPKRRSARNEEIGGGGSSTPQNYDLAVQVGEDAYFLRPDALGVADGVGGWKHKDKVKQLGGNGKEKAVESNSALFAKKLMHFCSWELAEFHKKNKTGRPATTSSPSPTTKSTSSKSPSTSSPASPLPSPDPIDILQSAYDRCLVESQESNVLGSSTALLAILVDSELQIAHLGDCAVCLIRDGEMAFRSEEMQHSFNYPYQLGPKSASTPAKDAKRFTVEVQPDDILILASDGMGDNLWDEDVVDEVGRYLRHLKQKTRLGEERKQHRGSVSNAVMAQRLSEALASRAKRVSERRAGGEDSRSSRGSPMDRGNEIFRSREAVQTSPQLHHPAPMMASSSTTSLGVGQFPPTPPPTPKLNASRTINYHPGDGFGGDGEYGGAGRNEWWGDEEEEEEEWVLDETPFGRKAKESGLKFVGGKDDDISVLVAIISGAPTPSTPSSNPVSAALPPKLTMSGSSWIAARP